MEMPLAQRNIFNRLRTWLFPQPPQASEPQIPANVVRKRLVETIGPILEANGFARFDRNRAWRHSERWVDVVEIHFFKTWTTTRHSPSLAIGRYFTFIPQNAMADPIKKEKGRVWPTEPLCHFRKVIYKSVKQRQTKEPNIWFIGAHGEYLDDCVEDARHLTETQVIPWFKWLDDLNVVLQLLRSGNADMGGRDPDPVKRGTWNFTDYFSRHVVAGLIALELKQWKLAAECLAPVLEHGGVVGRKGQVFPLPQDTLEQIRIAYAGMSN